MIERDTELRVIADHLQSCREKYGIRHIMISADDKGIRIHGWDGREQIYQAVKQGGENSEEKTE